MFGAGQWTQHTTAGSVMMVMITNDPPGQYVDSHYIIDFNQIYRFYAARGAQVSPSVKCDLCRNRLFVAMSDNWPATTQYSQPGEGQIID